MIWGFSHYFWVDTQIILITSPGCDCPGVGAGTGATGAAATGGAS